MGINAAAPTTLMERAGAHLRRYKLHSGTLDMLTSRVQAYRICSALTRSGSILAIGGISLCTYCSLILSETYEFREQCTYLLCSNVLLSSFEQTMATGLQSGMKA